MLNIAQVAPIGFVIRTKFPIRNCQKNSILPRVQGSPPELPDYTP